MTFSDANSWFGPDIHSASASANPSPQGWDTTYRSALAATRMPHSLGQLSLAVDTGLAVSLINVGAVSRGLAGRHAQSGVLGYDDTVSRYQPLAGFNSVANTTSLATPASAGGFSVSPLLGSFHGIPITAQLSGLKLFGAFVVDRFLFADTKTGEIDYKALAFNLLFPIAFDTLAIGLPFILAGSFITAETIAAGTAEYTFLKYAVAAQASVDLTGAALTSVVGQSPVTATTTIENFLFSTVGIAVSCGIALVPAVTGLGLAGVGLGVLLGYTATAVAGAGFDYFQYFSNTQAAQNYFRNFVNAGSDLLQQINTSVAEVKQTLINVENFFSSGGLTTIENYIDNTVNDLHDQAVQWLDDLTNTSGILTSMANYFIGIGDYGDALNIEYNIQPELARMAQAIGTAYPQFINVIDAVQTDVERLGSRVTVDYSIVSASPDNGAAYSDAYTAIGNFNDTLITELQDLSAVIAATSPEDLGDGGYGVTTPTPPTNGTITGTTGADVLFGATTASIFNGLGATSGVDVEVGVSGQDTFLYDPAYGLLDIEERLLTPGATSSAVLEIGGTITASMVTVTATANGDAVLTIADGNTDDQITLEEEFRGSNFGVADVTFSSGPGLTRAQLLQLAAENTAENATLYGTKTAETFSKLALGDTVVGLGDGDVIDYAANTGAVTITETNTVTGTTAINTLVLGAGITQAEVTATADAQGDLVLTIADGSTAPGGDSVTITGEYSGAAGTGIGAVIFSNGTTWTLAHLQGFGAVPTTGPDILWLSTPGTINGLGGGDIIHGSGGADTFIYEAGYGSLEIVEQSSTGAASTAVLNVGGADTLGTVTVTGDSNGDLILHFTATDTVQVDDALLGSADGIARAVDSKGTTLTAAQLIALEENGAAGSLTLYGTSGTNSFTNLGHGDGVVADGSNDHFAYASGAGTLSIAETNANLSRSAVLQLAGIASTAATFSIVSGTENILLTDGVSGDQITLDGMANNTNEGVTSIAFSDKTLSADQVVALATGSLSVTGVGTQSSPLMGGPGYNIIKATAKDAYIVSPGITDSITATHGASTIILQANAAGLPHNATIALGHGSNKVTAVDGSVTVSGLAGGDTIQLGNGKNSVSGGGTANVVSVLAGASTIALGSANASSSHNTVSVLSGGKVTLIGSSNDVLLASATGTDATLYGATTVSLSGSSNDVTAHTSHGQILGDAAASSADTFSLTDALGGTVSVLGTGDMVVLAGGTTDVADGGKGLALVLGQDAAKIDPDLLLSGFLNDSSVVLTLATDLGYSTLAGVLAALTTDGETGSFLPFTGANGAGIDFTGVSVGSLTAFLNAGHHIVFG